METSTIHIVLKFTMEVEATEARMHEKNTGKGPNRTQLRNSTSCGTVCLMFLSCETT